MFSFSHPPSFIIIFYYYPYFLLSSFIIIIDQEDLLSVSTWFCHSVMKIEEFQKGRERERENGDFLFISFPPVTIVLRIDRILEHERK